MNITITQNATDKIAELLLEENNPAIRLRMYVQGGGCSGMSYGFAMDDEKNEDDFEVASGDTVILVDSLSAQYLLNASVDYVENLMGASFKISNPQAQTTCGCGSSFNPF